MFECVAKGGVGRGGFKPRITEFWSSPPTNPMVFLKLDGTSPHVGRSNLVRVASPAVKNPGRGPGPRAFCRAASISNDRYELRGRLACRLGRAIGTVGGDDQNSVIPGLSPPLPTPPPAKIFHFWPKLKLSWQTIKVVGQTYLNKFGQKFKVLVNNLKILVRILDFWLTN